MEQIKRAVERAKASATGEQLRSMAAMPDQFARPQELNAGLLAPAGTPAPVDSQFVVPSLHNKIKLEWPQLEQNRIVGHNVNDPRSKAFDVLRTQVLQAMDQKNWQFLAITSPTEGCGKTVTAINLALSIARKPERSALLIDMDLQRPSVANYLGIKSRDGVQGVLKGRTALADAIIRAQVDKCELLVLPAEAPTVRSSELISSPNMGMMLQDIKRSFKSCTVVFDMPPLLQGDEVLATLPRIDCILLVTAVGVSTLHEIKECNRHLQASEVVRLVLNKSHETTKRHYYY